MPYEILIFDQASANDNVSSLFPKVATNDYRNKRGHQNSSHLIDKKISEIGNNPNAFNGEKALFYFKNGDQTLKIVSEDYASVNASLALNANNETAKKQRDDGGYLRSHFAAGVIVICKTSDKKFVIGSRDAAINKNDPTDYPLQFPCGFLDVSDNFYQNIRDKKTPLPEIIIENGKRELCEEVFNFSDEEIMDTSLVGAIYETKKWIQKEEKGGGTKDVNVIKSFVVRVDINITSEELLKKREEEITKTKLDFDIATSNKDESDIRNFGQKMKDFGEMTKLGFLEFYEIQHAGVATTIDFDDKPRQFVAEHGATLNLIENLNLIKKIPSNNVSTVRISTLLEEEKEGNKSSENLSNYK